jgi:hypothetical protein
MSAVDPNADATAALVLASRTSRRLTAPLFTLDAS